MLLSHMTHFHLVFLPGHIIGSMVNHQSMTLCPSQFSFENDCIIIWYTDRKNAKHTESILCQYLALYSPQKGGGRVVFIKGARTGSVCNVKKTKCAEGTLDLVTSEQELIVKQDRCTVAVWKHILSCVIALLPAFIVKNVQPLMCQ